MKVLVMTTWENPKSDERLKKYYENLNKYKNYRDEKNKKHKVKQTSWSDGSGKIYVLGEFESYESYAQYQDDEEYQKNMIALFRLVNNVEVKVLRESIWVPT